MIAGGTTVWPNDIVGDPQELARESPHKLVCFLLSPFEPRDLFDPVHDAVRAACNLCAQAAGVNIECRRADTLYEAKAIHDDIWRHIVAADFLVVDVTGLNPNVMIEFGVAAATRRPSQVILIKAADDDSHLPFNAFAQRYLPYRRSIVGDQEFLGGLYQAMIQAVTPAPYVPQVLAPPPPSGFRVDFRDGDRPDLLLGPSMTHRRYLGDSLEYGSFYIFQNSWLLLTDGNYRNLRVRLRFRFSKIVGEPGDAFIGLSLRNQHFHANWGHLVLLRGDGRVVRTEPQDDLGNYRDIEVGSVNDFDYRSPEFLCFEAEFNDQALTFKVGNLAAPVFVSDMPYVYSAGKARLATSMCRILLREVELTPL